VIADASVPSDWTREAAVECFRFAAWNGLAADWLLPAPAFLEELTDVPAAPTSALATYSIAPALMAAPAGVKSMAQFLAEVDDSIGTVESEIAARAPAGLRPGEVWSGPSARPAPLWCHLRDWPRAVAHSADSSWTASFKLPVLPPLAGKLYRESDLQPAPERRNS
jgi:hypothetical protein